MTTPAPSPFTDAMQVSIESRVDALNRNLAYSPPEQWDERFQQLKTELVAHLFQNLKDHPMQPASSSIQMCRELWGPPGNRSLTCTMPAGHGPHPTTLGHGFAGKCSGRFRIPGSGRTRDSVCSLPLGHEDECGI